MLAMFLEERDLARRSREAREWLTQDDRARVLGLILFSIAISILMSLLATAVVGFVSRRRATAPGEPAVLEMPDDEAPVAPDAVGIPVMDVEAPAPEAPETVGA
jgi:hypothetical protein